MLSDYKISYEIEISKNNAVVLLLKISDPYKRMTGDKTASKKLKTEDCGKRDRTEDFGLLTCSIKQK
jgi:hypothetical protein